jgi:hypothetical protein
MSLSAETSLVRPKRVLLVSQLVSITMGVLHDRLKVSKCMGVARWSGWPPIPGPGRDAVEVTPLSLSTKA